MSKLQIQQGRQESQVLSKEQKRFNSLLKKIKSTQTNIALVEELYDYLQREGEAKIRHVEIRLFELERQMVLDLHNAPDPKSLPPKTKQKFDRIMVEMIHGMLSSTLYSEDEELHKLYAYYSENGNTYAEQQALEEAHEKEMAAEMARMLFGVDLDTSDFDDPEKLHEKISAKKEEMEREYAEQQKRSEEKKAARKKSPKQLEAEAKRAAAESMVKKSVKAIYHDLVKNFHPDREPDEALRAEKTELMKQITAAYDADDHLKLLELQITLLSGRDNAFANFDDQQLRYFNKSLEAQADELLMALSFARNMVENSTYSHLFDYSKSGIDFQISQHLKQVKQAIKETEFTLQDCKTTKGLKTFIKHYELDDDEDSFFF
jgi:hypothetical protein